MQKNTPQLHASSEPDLIDDIIQKWQATDIPETTYIGTEIIGRMSRMNAFIQLQVENNLAKHNMNIGDFNLLAVLLREEPQERSEERRVGKECRSGWWTYQYNKKG